MNNTETNDNWPTILNAYNSNTTLSDLKKHKSFLYAHLLSERTRLVLAAITACSKLYDSQLADIIIPTLIKITEKTNKVLSTSARKLLLDVVKVANHTVIPTLLENIKNPNKFTRLTVLSCFITIFAKCDHSTLESVLKTCIVDASSDVRDASRTLFSLYKDEHPEALPRFLSSIDDLSKKYLNINPSLNHSNSSLKSNQNASNQSLNRSSSNASLTKSNTSASTPSLNRLNSTKPNNLINSSSNDSTHLKPTLSSKTVQSTPKQSPKEQKSSSELPQRRMSGPLKTTLDAKHPIANLGLPRKIVEQKVEKPVAPLSNIKISKVISQVNNPKLEKKRVNPTGILLKSRKPSQVELVNPNEKENVIDTVHLIESELIVSGTDINEPIVNGIDQNGLSLNQQPTVIDSDESKKENQEEEETMPSDSIIENHNHEITTNEPTHLSSLPSVSTPIDYISDTESIDFILDAKTPLQHKISIQQHHDEEEAHELFHLDQPEQQQNRVYKDECNTDIVNDGSSLGTLSGIQTPTPLSPCEIQENNTNENTNPLKTFDSIETLVITNPDLSTKTLDSIIYMNEPINLLDAINNLECHDPLIRQKAYEFCSNRIEQVSELLQMDPLFQLKLMIMRNISDHP